MENQNPPPFPFDAFDPSEELSAADFLSAAASMPTSPAIDADASMRAIMQKLQDLDAQLHAIIALLEREGRSGIVPSSSISTFLSPTNNREFSRPAMPYARTIDPVPETREVEDGNALRVIEGVFDGQNMVGPDGKHYSVPANYASKSKLVEGDILKLTITGRGAFVYKQIGPIARDRRVGVLERDDVTGEFIVIVAESDGDRSVLTRAVCERVDLPEVPYKRYRSLRASITYYHGSPGDEVVLLVPKDAPSTWAAVENIIRR